jgi:hypothetical protein
MIEYVFAFAACLISCSLFFRLITSDTFAAIDKRFASYISLVGKGISSGKTAPVPKTPPVRRPKENER